MTLYHYTDQNGFVGIFNNEELWATKIQYLNDEKEYTLALDLAENYLNELLESAVSVNDTGRQAKLKYYLKIIPNIKDINICVCSLTENGDLLSQWRGYSKTLGGYSVGFNEFALRPFIEVQGFELEKCVYDQDEQVARVQTMIDDTLNEFSYEPAPGYKEIAYYESGDEFLDRLAKIAPLLKGSSFAEECEWRIILTANFENLEFRAGASMLTPYFKVSLDSSKNRDFDRLIDEIIVGHTPHPDLAVSATEAFLLKLLPPSNYDYTCKIQVRKSAIPFRNW
ncbi:DUF2971 domain-containing protein [Vibrio metschnikovii]|nr:DUF2971 domain-containing protein [Vibrio metschnikovii]EKO3612295.1 DUF2971 domain-containing protein [Vibrio metschnikovii]EKO3685008.1 DUF2971 domain-containing protein [Vibrio metschnikovii]EKO3740312.1 DUF2971 domain-containing protein [Vibrio metschnikovii]